MTTWLESEDSSNNFASASSMRREFNPWGSKYVNHAYFGGCIEIGKPGPPLAGRHPFRLHRGSSPGVCPGPRSQLLVSGAQHGGGGVPQIVDTR